jgi:hypothetical protein
VLRLHAAHFVDDGLAPHLEQLDPLGVPLLLEENLRGAVRALGLAPCHSIASFQLPDRIAFLETTLLGFAVGLPLPIPLVHFGGARLGLLASVGRNMDQGEFYKIN